MKKALKPSLFFIMNIAFGIGYSIIVSRYLGVELRGVLYSYQLPALIVASVIFGSCAQPLYDTLKTLKGSEELSFHLPIKVYAVTILACVLLSALVVAIISTIQNVPVNFWYLFALSVSQGLSIFLQDLAKYNVSKKRFLFTQLSAPGLLLFCTVFLILLFETITVPLALLALISAYTIAHFVSLFFIKNTFVLNKKAFITNEFYSVLVKFGGFKILAVFANYVDKFLIVALFTPLIAGYIAVCMTLESVSSKLFTFLSNMEINKHANRIESQATVSKLVLLSVVVGVVGLGFSYFFGNLVLTLLFGADFSPAYQFLNIIIFISVANGIAWVASQKWVIDQRYKRIYSRQIVGILIVLCGAIYVWLNRADAMSFLYVMSLSSAVRFIFTSYFYIKDLRGNEFEKQRCADA